MMTTFTLMFALALGVVGVRVLNPSYTELTFDSSYSTLLQQSFGQEKQEVASIEVPEMDFVEIKVPEFKLPKKAVIVAEIRPNTIRPTPITPKPIRPVIIKPKEIRPKEIRTSVDLPFEEQVTIRPVVYEGEMLSNLVALYDGLPVEEKVMVAEKTVEKTDEVKTTQAAEKKIPVETEPEFFEYKEEPVEVAAAPAPEKEKVIENVNIVVQEVAAVQPKDQKEEVKANADTNLVAFDYSAMKQDIQDSKVPTVSMVTTHHKSQAAPVKKDPTPTPAPVIQEEKAARKFASQMTIQGVATNLKKTEMIQNFEIRFQDNTNEILEDYGDGEVTTTVKMARSKMTRSMVLLKRGFVPTNTDLIFEDGAGSVSIPVLQQEQFDELTRPYENKGAVGAILVELADETEKATIDAPFGMVITLDGDMKETSREDFRYQLYVGVKAGNAILTYVHGNETTNKIIHVHDRELTYESNFFEKTNLKKVSLFQEDLLAREKAPLVTASENVKVFAKNVTGVKLNQNTYKIDFGKALLGGRNYLELTHESEPIFVGTKEEAELSVPSESFMRHILGSLPENKLGNRCLIQVNTKKKISEVYVGAESVAESLMTTVQYLDADGRFYDSASEKTRKVIVYGENQGSENEMTGKVNLKIMYLDGTVDFLGSYCSPNTYLVEQL
ncbi:MAG: hypothetical protein ACJ76H_00650 [Bacteriovoracaceae bacterium]